MALLAQYEKGVVEVGCDEAGRGCYAGPVYAAAVVLNPKLIHHDLNDSKKLNIRKRNQLRSWIEENSIAWSIGTASVEEIDQINILNASFLAMHRAIEKITVPYEILLIDGNRFTPFPDTKHLCIIKGDSKFSSIAAASILAKTHRDAYMQQLAEQHPAYDWKNNQGYGTLKHREAIQAHGICEHHRQSFNLFGK